MSSLTISAVAERTPYRDGVGDFNFVVEKEYHPFETLIKEMFQLFFVLVQG